MLKNELLSALKQGDWSEYREDKAFYQNKAFCTYARSILFLRNIFILLLKFNNIAQDMIKTNIVVAHAIRILHHRVI